MIVRALLVWLAVCVVAILNGGFREKVLKAKLGERPASVISPLLLSAFILISAWTTIGWIAPSSFGDAWAVGLLWTALTLAFEFLVGHYVFGNPWEKLLSDYRVDKGRVWVMVPIILAFAPALSFHGMRSQDVLPYFISNTIAVLTLAAAIWRPSIARWIIFAIFGYACIFNGQLALRQPEQYQGFADLAIVPFYRDFITGPFREHAREFLLAIAIGQGVTAAAMAIRPLLWIGALGVTVFLMCIAPLGVGSAFPFSVLVSLAAIVAVGGLTKQKALC
jgi:hypothetical protein